MPPWPVLKWWMRSACSDDRLRHTADGTRRSTVGTLNMGTWAGTGEALAWDIASDVPSTSPSQGSNSGAHRESHSTHTYAFKRSCADDSCNTPVIIHQNRTSNAHWMVCGSHRVSRRVGNALSVSYETSSENLKSSDTHTRVRVRSH